MPSKAYQVLCGNLGSKFGKLGGRPSNKNKRYGLASSEYKEIVAFLLSNQSKPIYPIRMRGGSSRSESKTEKRKYSQNKDKRKEFREKCSKFTVEDGVLYPYVKFGSASKKTEDESNEGK